MERPPRSPGVKLRDRSKRLAAGSSDYRIREWLRRTPQGGAEAGNFGTRRRQPGLDLGSSDRNDVELAAACSRIPCPPRRSGASFAIHERGSRLHVPLKRQCAVVAVPNLPSSDRATASGTTRDAGRAPRDHRAETKTATGSPRWPSSRIGSCAAYCFTISISSTSNLRVEFGPMGPGVPRSP